MKKIIRRSAYAGALAVGLAFVSNFAYAHDASNSTTGQWSGRAWSNVGNWTRDTLPDGRATFTGSNLTGQSNPTFSVDCSPCVEGVDFGNFAVPFVDNPISFSGKTPFVSCAGNGTEIRCQLRGADAAGDQRLYKLGAGSLTLTTPAANFSAVVVRRGTLLSKVTSGTAFVNGPALEIGQGDAKWQPAASAGAEVAVVANGVLKSGKGDGRFVIAGGQAAQASITFTSLDLTPGGILEIVPTSLAALGDTERILFASSPTLRNGVLPPNVFARDASDKICLLTYDAEKGVVPYAGEIPELVVGAANALAKLTADMTVSAATSVGTLVVENDAKLSVADDVTLTVGNDGQPAGFVVNSTTGASFLPNGEKGTVDFGSSHGVFLHNNSAGSGSRFSLTKAKIAGQAGLTVAAARSGKVTDAAVSATFQLSTSQWAGSTVLAGIRAGFNGDHNTPLPLPSKSDVWMLGVDAWESSTHASWLSYRSFTIDQDLHLAGNGRSDSGVIHMGANVQMTVRGTTTLEAPCRFVNDNPSEGQHYAGRVTGPGAFVFGQGTYDFYTTNDYAGTTTFLSGHNATLRLHKSATFGKRKVTANGSGKIEFDGMTGAPIVADISYENATPVKVSSSTVRLMGNASFSGMQMSGSSNRIEVGATTTVKALAGATPDDAFVAAADGATLVLESDADGAMAADIADGAAGERLNVRKEGVGTLTLVGPKSGSGAYDVREGTLRIAGLLETASYWLDASDEQSVATDVDDRVTAWRSQVGDTSFVKSADHTAPNYTNSWTVGGEAKRVLSFHGATVAERLIGNADTLQRTVFIVNRQQNCAGRGYGIFGWFNQDCGQRSSGFNWYSDAGAWDFVTVRPGLAVNGTFTSQKEIATVRDQPHVLTLVHRADKYNASYNRSSPSSFTAAIGGYFPTSNEKLGRSFDGEIAEVIAFPRVLSPEEIEWVEDYLSRKWLDRDLHGSGAQSPALSDEVSVTLARDAALDLNGRNLSLAALNGVGTVTNSSSTAVTLTVAGGNFAGRVVGKVNLVRAGADGEIAVSFDGADAKLTLSGGTAAVAPSSADRLTVTNGLSFWVDASFNPAETILTNANGAIASWICRGGTIGRFRYDEAADHPSWKGATDGPSFDATGFRGKPSVFFEKTQCLVSDRAATVKTVFLVSTCLCDQPGNGYMWGPWGADSGYRYGGRELQTAGGISFTHVGETQRLNGVDKTGSSKLAMPEYFVLVARKCEWGLNTKFTNVQFTLNRCHSNGGAIQKMAEAIAYDRMLTDEELLRVEAYLLEKWVRSPEGQFPVPPTQAFTNGAALDLTDGARLVYPGDAAFADMTLTFDVGGRTSLDEPLMSVGGSLTLDNVMARFLNYLNLTKHVRHPFLHVGGVRTGDFAGDNLERRYVRESVGSDEVLVNSHGLTIIVR